MSVCVVDRDREALRRMREDIYPARYGCWDEGITLHTAEDEPFRPVAVPFAPLVRIALEPQHLAGQAAAFLDLRGLTEAHDGRLGHFINPCTGEESFA